MKALLIRWVLCFAIIFARASSYNITTFNAGKQPYYRKPKSVGSYLSFLFHVNSALEVHEENKLRLATQDYKPCIFACASNLNCFSINFGKQPSYFDKGKAMYLCELLPTDKYNSSSTYQRYNPRFDHYSIKSECNKSPCLHNFPCVPNYENNTYECACPRPPFEGKDCKDVDECSTGQNDCHVNAICTNTVGSFNCSCKDDLLGDGRNCIKIMLQSDILKDYGNSSYLLALKTFMDQVPEDIENISCIRCWSGKNDGFNVTVTFHPHCDNKGPTLTIVRKNHFIFGGYTDVSWSSPPPHKVKGSTKSFIFSLYNIHGFNPQKFDNVNSDSAVRHADVWGPTFAFDLCISNLASTGSNFNRP